MMRPTNVKVTWAMPLAPTNLLFTRGSVILDWSDATPVDYLDPTTWGNPVAGKGGTNPQQEVGFHIWRAPANTGQYVMIKNVPANTTHYVDLTADPYTSYDYKVTAWNGTPGDVVNESQPTNVITALAVPHAPTSLVATVNANPALAGGSQVDLQWANNDLTAASIEIQRAVGAGAFVPLTTLADPSFTTYSDTTVLPGDYSYQVRVVNGAGPSPWSNIASATVGKVDSSTSIGTSKTPTFVGESVTFTATVSSTGATSTPTGTVLFTAGPQTFTATLSGGVATYITDTLLAGSYTVTADYSGDGIFLSSSGSVGQTVNQGSTSTGLQSSQNPSVNGDSVTFTATVTPSGGVGTPTGSVEFFDNGISVGVAPLAGNTAVLSVPVTGVGAHPMSAIYTGDTNFTGSSGALIQDVGKGSVTVGITSDGTPSAFGNPVTFTATVTAATGAGSPGSMVEFFDNGTSLGQVALATGQAQVITSALSVGSHTILVNYLGDANFAVGSASMVQQVGQGTTSLTVGGTPSPSTYGQSVTLSATINVASGAGSPNGLVSFYDGATLLGTVVSSGSAASVDVPAFTGGSHVIFASFNGDTNFLGSSGTFTQVVNQATTSTALTSDINPSLEGQLVTFMATVSNGGPALPTGTVQFVNGTGNLGSPVQVINGVATLPFTFTTAGVRSVTATYSGDGNYSGSTSAVLTQTVQRATSTTVTSNRVPSASFGQNITFTATVRPVTGTGFPTAGTVQFFNGTGLLGNGTYTTNGRWTFTTNTLSVGPHTITADFLGSGLFAASSGTYTQQVNQAATTTTLSSSVNPSVFGQAVTFTARVQPAAATGTVGFYEGVTLLGTGTLDATGRARLTISSLGVGGHSITATYLGSTNYLGSSTTAPLTQTVNKGNSRAIIATSLTPVLHGTNVTLSATVTAVAPASGTPTGTVDFYSNGAFIGTGTLSNGTTSIQWTSNNIGRFTISATYNGDGNFNPDPSNTFTQRFT